MSYERKPTFKSIVVSIIVLLIGLGIGSVVSGGKQKSIIQQLERENATSQEYIDELETEIRISTDRIAGVRKRIETINREIDGSISLIEIAIKLTEGIEIIITELEGIYSSGTD